MTIFFIYLGKKSVEINTFIKSIAFISTIEATILEKIPSFITAANKVAILSGFFFRSESRHTIEETRSTYVSLLPLVSLLEWLQHNKRQKKLVSLKPHFSFFKKLFINKAKGRHEATFNEAYTAFMSYRKYIFFAQNVNIF